VSEALFITCIVYIIAIHRATGNTTESSCWILRDVEITAINGVLKESCTT